MALKRKAIVSFEINMPESDAQELLTFMNSHKEEIVEEVGGFVSELRDDLEKALAPRAKPGRRASGGESNEAASESAAEPAEEPAPQAAEATEEPAPTHKAKRDRNGNLVEEGHKTRVTVPV